MNTTSHNLVGTKTSIDQLSSSVLENPSKLSTWGPHSKKQAFSYEQAMERVMSIDLGCVKFKLMDQDDGEGWTREQAMEVEKWYKRFLCLIAMYPEKAIVPTKLIDKFWHYHILDTEKYAEDCQMVFGRFLHHFPYFGMRGEEDRQRFLRAGAETAHLYESIFRESVMNFDGHRSSIADTFALCGPCADGDNINSVRPTVN